MSYVDDLKTARDRVAASLAANAGKPNWSFDGESVDWNGMFDRLRKIDEAITAAEGAVVIESHGVI